MEDNRSLYKVFVEKGIYPLILTGIVLIFVGFFLIAQSVSGQLLPHDVHNLGMTTAQLSFFNEGKVLKFMFHDRVAFGGSLISVGLLYSWLAAFPLKQGKAWAWWLFVISGLSGFGSFLTYLGYGYLDSWHGIGTLLLFPLYIAGLYYSYSSITGPKTIRYLLIKNADTRLNSKLGLGNIFLLFTSVGLFLGGITIMIVGMTTVFVPQDLGYMQIKVCGLTQFNSKLIPIIAHDRASFGGGLATIGVMFFFSIWCSKPGRGLWEILALSMSVGFSTAIGVHFWIKYFDFWHIAPAYFGLLVFYIGLFLTYKEMVKDNVHDPEIMN